MSLSTYQRRPRNRAAQVMASALAGYLGSQLRSEAVRLYNHATGVSAPGVAPPRTKRMPTQRKRRPPPRQEDMYRSVYVQAPGNDLTRSKRKARTARPKRGMRRLATTVNAMLDKHVYRFQNLTQYDTNVGGIPLCWHYNSTSLAIELPIHVYDITAHPNNSTQVAGYALGWLGTGTASDLTRRILPGQTSSGAADTAGLWYDETMTSALSVHPRAVHNWTSIGLNLYGARKRTTIFNIYFVRVRKQESNLFDAPVTSQKAQQFLQCLERPLIYSNLQVDAGNKLSAFAKVIKKYTCTVSAASTTDIDTTTGKIHEQKIFLRHGTNLNYDDIDSATYHLGHSLADGLDYARDETVFNVPKENQRILMIVTAFCPERSTSTVDIASSALDASYQPSYDVIIRNSFSKPF